MNPAELLANFERISDAPNAIPELRYFILGLAVRGKLVNQDPGEESAAETIKRARSPRSKWRSLASLRSDELQFILPAGWQADRFGNLLELQYGKALPAEKRINDGPVAAYGSNGIVGFCSQSLTDQPAIIVGRKGSAGALNVSLTPSWTTDVAYFLCAPEYFEIKFLFHLLKALRLEKLSRGIKPGLNREEAYRLPVVVPPLREQRRIVAKLEELMALCDDLETAQIEREKQRESFTLASGHYLDQDDNSAANYERASFFLSNFPAITSHSAQIPLLRRTILNLAVRGRLVLQDQEDEPVFALLERIYSEQRWLITAGTIPKRKIRLLDTQSKLTFYPPGSWETVAFGELCNIVTSGSRGWAEYYSESGPKFIRAQNVRFGRLVLDDLACVSPPPDTEGTRTQVGPGDILIVITGAGVTTPALLCSDLGEAYVSQHVALAKPTDLALSPWLLLCLMAPLGGRAQLLERAYGAGKPGLNLDNIRSLPIPLPPLPEQRRIIAKLDQLMALTDKLEERLSNQQTRRRQLLEAILHHTLNDPHYASAGEVAIEV